MKDEHMSLYAMVDKAGHVCRDEDGKVVYDREDHHALDVRRFDMHRPESKPHRVVRFDAHLTSREAKGGAVAEIRHFTYAGIARNGESMEAVVVDGTTLLPEGTKLYTHPAAREAAQPIICWMLRDETGETYIDENCLWLDEDDAIDAAEHMDDDEHTYTPFAVVAAQPKGEVVQPVEAVDERQSFEAWVRSWMIGEGDADRALARDQFDQYPDEEIDFKYVGWMGRAALAHPRPTGDGYDVARHNEWLEANASPAGEQAAEVWESAHGYQEAFYKIAEILDIGAMPESPSKVFASVMLPMIRELVAAQPRPVGVPDGWKLMPNVSTLEMLQAGEDEVVADSTLNPAAIAEKVWNVMCAAAPAPGKGGEA